MTSAELERAKARYREARSQACRLAVDSLSSFLEVDFHLREWSRKALEAIDHQWGSSEFDWGEIARRYREPGIAHIAIWSPDDRLSGVFMATIHAKSVKLQWLEGDPRVDCPLKGKRALVALEMISNYAQLLGRPEICLDRVEDDVIPLYVEGYGFTLVTPNKGSPYLKKAV
nr:hypothetical protein [Nitrosomonas nitrosa]